jgi:hypothetical protein
MKRLLAGCILALCCACPAYGDPVPTKKPDPVQSVTIPWNVLNASATAVAKKMMESPTVLARGPSESFTCTPKQYYWLLDNPDSAVTAWRRLGAKCVSIQKRGQGKFAYTDDAGSEIVWETIHQGPGMRVWFAEGKIKASSVLPLVPVKALVILRHKEAKTSDGVAYVQHHTEVVIHTDSKAAAAVTKLMGQSAPRLAEQGLGQLQLFFSALSCYVDRHPERVDMLFRTEK